MFLVKKINVDPVFIQKQVTHSIKYFIISKLKKNFQIQIPAKYTQEKKNQL